LTLVLGILNDGPDVGFLNHIFIVLIPKIKKLDCASHFGPITLCNVIFKLVTMTIANRLKPILSDIISDHQSAFVPNRLITDYTFLAFKCFHYMKKKTGDQNGPMAFKLDMSKAYDRVEWSFLKKTLMSMGFPDHFATLILRCVSAVSFSAMLNGTPHKHFFPHRGLRQGDPLSPYLFIIYAEVLSSMILRAIESRSLHGLKNNPISPC